MVEFYGSFLRLQDQLCVVVGGGRIALRKVRKLLDAGARVQVVSPDVIAELATAADEGLIERVQRPFQPGDTAGAFLTCAATNDRQVNRLVAEEVIARGGLVNVVDDPSLCTFIVPAVWSADGLQVTISTGGRNPRAAKKMRRALAQDVDTGMGALASAIRTYLDERS